MADKNDKPDRFTVRDLVEALAALDDQDALVCLTSDPEGNQEWFFGSIGIGRVVDDGHLGPCQSIAHTKEDAEKEGDGDLWQKSKPAIFFQPGY